MKPFALAAITSGKTIVDLHGEKLTFLGEVNKPNNTKLLVWEYVN